VFPNYPYEREDSRAFFNAVKENNILSVEGFLRNCKYHVYDYDSVKKANYQDVIFSFIIEFDQSDKINRTSLGSEAQLHRHDISAM